MSDSLLLLLPQLRALKAQVEALLFMAEMHAVMLAPQPSDAAQKCPKCGGDGDTQIDQSTLDGVRRVFCANCRELRVLSGVT